ncbi:MAG: ferrochelatase [Moorea sp. SIO4A3]|nr:ferrochelatase [Moorena sp. SIO4A3]
MSIAFQNHYQKFHDGIFGSIPDQVNDTQNQKKLLYKKPCVIGVEGSFKCGGSFPYLLGGELVYAQSSGDKFTVTASSIKEAFDSAQKSDRVPVAFIWEEPTALGFILRNEALAEIAELIKEYLAKYPDMVILIDAYNGGLFREDKIPSLYADPLIRKNAIYTTSMRKKIPAANWGLITPIACGNKTLKEKLSLFFGSNSFYTVSQFSKLETLVASNIMEKFLNQGGSVEYQFENFDYATRKIAQINHELGVELISPYANPEAGINYFIQFDDSFLSEKSCRDAQHLCQTLTLITGLHCSIPSAMGIPGFGVRINLMRGQQALTEEGFKNSQEYIDEVLNRLKYFLLALEQGIFSFNDFEEIIACAGKDLEIFSEPIISLQNNFLAFMNVKDSKLVSLQ